MGWRILADSATRNHRTDRAGALAMFGQRRADLSQVGGYTGKPFAVEVENGKKSCAGSCAGSIVKVCLQEQI